MDALVSIIPFFYLIFQVQGVKRVRVSTFACPLSVINSFLGFANILRTVCLSFMFGLSHLQRSPLTT